MKKNNRYNLDLSRTSLFIKFFFLEAVLIVLNFIRIPKSNKIIVSIFAGRQRYLKILMIYLQNLKYNKKISEIHFWQFTNQKSDIEYLNSISNIHKTNGNFPNYVDIYPEINNNVFIIKIKSLYNGSSILINNKYEINFTPENDNHINISFNINNQTVIEKSSNVYWKNIYLKYVIKIKDSQIIIEGQNNLQIKYFINENKFDSIKIKSLPNAETFWDYEESINKGIKLFDTIYRSGTIYWYEMYKFYLDYDYDIILKIDDDISFIDIKRFDEYINYIKLFPKNITFPNLVNHAVSLYYDIKEGLIPNNIIDQQYLNKSSSVDIFDYFRDGNQAKKIHKYFLDNINTFINNDMKPVLLNGQRPSISMFGITKTSFRKVYSPNAIWPNSKEPKNYLFGQDEPYSYDLLNNYMYSRLVCIHYAFGNQRQSGLDEKMLEDYTSLAYKYTKIKN